MQVVKQQLKTKTGEQLSGHARLAWRRCYHLRLLVCQSSRFIIYGQSSGLCWTHTDVVKEVRPLKTTVKRKLPCAALC